MTRFIRLMILFSLIGGGILSFIGLIQFILGQAHDDQDDKYYGLRTFITGLLIILITIFYKNSLK